MPKEETIQQIKIRNVIGELSDVATSNQRGTLSSQIKSLQLRSMGIPQYSSVYGLLEADDILTLNSGENGGFDIVMDGSYLYVGCYVGTIGFDPSKVVKIDMSNFTRHSVCTFNSGENRLYTLLIDSTYIYAIIDPNPPNDPVKIVRITKADFTRKDVLTLNANDNSATGGVILGGQLYVGLATKIVKVNLETFTRTSSLTTTNNIYNINTDGIFLYTGSGNSPAQITKIDIDSFTENSIITLNTGENIVGDSIYDGYNYIYYGLNTSPAIIVRLNTVTFKRDSILTLSQNSVLSMGIDGRYLYATYSNSTDYSIIDCATFTELYRETVTGPTLPLYTILTDGLNIYTVSFDNPAQVIKRNITSSGSVTDRRISNINEQMSGVIIKESITTSNGIIGKTDLIDSSRTEANDYWNNMVVVILNGNSNGQSRRISDFDNATGTITVDTAFNAQILSGTKYKIISQSLPAVSTLTQADILSDATPFAGADIAIIKADTQVIEDSTLKASPTAGSLAQFIASGGTALGTQLPDSKSLYDCLSGGVTTVDRVDGKTQVIEVSITSAANVGDVTVATVTTQPCLIKSIITHADTAQTANMTSCATFGGASKVITFIDAVTAVQANLDAIDKQVAWTGAVRLAATKTIVISLVGNGGAAVDLTVTIEYEACVNGGYLT